MHANVVTRTLVGATAAVGITAGSLAGASAGFAASLPAAQPVVSRQDVSVLAVNNLGLNATQARHWQCWLNYWHFSPGTIDGKLGPKSWKAAQRFFNYYDYNVGRKLVVDGIVGSNTIKALQNFLGVGIDGIAGPRTRAAFADGNNTDWCAR
ncbi:peptidoglycan-binding protein [Streptomyces actuosus]|uniref:Peptidoglycan-binding protein n=1 Tax=Streptomyces actuosus TaxID=1885 RepID=A0ABS2VHH7_STRAS|nr:peptidoglycan-binding domain-containing protein [Streptomyces actuosus]MBN0042536.1 peptidoglycan-binding protein [Streptomyces actuosus]